MRIVLQAVLKVKKTNPKSNGRICRNSWHVLDVDNSRPDRITKNAHSSQINYKHSVKIYNSRVSLAVLQDISYKQNHSENFFTLSLKAKVHLETKAEKTQQCLSWAKQKSLKYYA
jgi:hypothetical protein